MRTVYFVTSNPGKFLEAKEKLSAVGVDLVQKNLGYPEVQADTLEDVARFGVDFIRKTMKYPFIIEDAGLFVDCLHGFPGVYSSYVFHTIGCAGILKLVEGKKPVERGACFRSLVAYAEPDQKPMFLLGECWGWISSEEVGDHGFGFDPIFIPQGETRTFALMEIPEKNRFSHRGKSLEKLADFFKKQ